MPGPLVCPSCAVEHGPDERFCRECGTPLVYAPGVTDGGPPLSEARERARKVRAGYRDGPLVRVASARNQAEAELVQNLLLEGASRRSCGAPAASTSPTSWPAGRATSSVPAAGAEAAQDLLRVDPSRPRLQSAQPEWVRALAVTLAVVILVTLAVGVLVALGR